MKARLPRRSPPASLSSSFRFLADSQDGSALRPEFECRVLASSYRWIYCETPGLRNNSRVMAELESGGSATVDVRVETRDATRSGARIRTSGLYTRYNGITQAVALSESTIGPAAAASAAIAASSGPDRNTSLLLEWLAGPLAQLTSPMVSHKDPSPDIHAEYLGSLFSPQASNTLTGLSITPPSNRSISSHPWPTALDAQAILVAVSTAKSSPAWVEPMLTGAWTSSASTVFGGSVVGWTQLREANDASEMPLLGAGMGAVPSSDGYMLQHSARATVARVRRVVPSDVSG